MFQKLLNDLTTGARKSAEASKLAYQKGEYNPSILKDIPGLRNVYHQELKTLGAKHLPRVGNIIVTSQCRSRSNNRGGN
jgi:hypothetical protein